MSDQKKHEQTKRRLKILGTVLTAAGGILFAVGAASFFTAMGGGGIPSLFWCCFVGLPLLGAGISCLRIGYRREVTRYIKNETVPVLNEAAEEMQPAIRAAARAVREESGREGCLCPRCGQANDADAKFCKECGAPLTRICPACGQANDADAKFCDRCGNPL